MLTSHLSCKLQPIDLQLSFLNWHLRDTSRLEVLGMPFRCTDTAQVSSSRSYWGCMRQLLLHLTIEAPALRSLEVVLLKDCRLDHSTEDQAQPGPHFRVSPLLGFMSQLQSLALCGWDIVEEDIPLISQLSKLQNLEVTSPLWASACFTLIRSGHALNHF